MVYEVICVNVTSSAVDIMAKVTNGPNYPESLKLCHSIVTFVWLESATGVGHWSYCPVLLLLYQDCPQSDTRGIHL